MYFCSFKVIVVVAKEAQTKYTSLRTQYVKSLNKVKVSSKSGAGTDGVTKVKWKYFNLLHFLRDTVTVESQLDTLQPLASPLTMDKSICDEEEEVAMSEAVASTSGSQGPASVDSSTSAQIEQGHPDNFLRRKRKRDDVDYSSIMRMAVNKLQEVSAPAPTPTQDDNELFGRSVASTLRGFKNDRCRAACKLRIQEVLYSFEYGADADILAHQAAISGSHVDIPHMYE